MGQSAARVGDIAVGTPHCHSVHPWSPVPHPNAGPIVSGAPTVIIGGSSAARIGDPGVHAACCGPNVYAIVGSSDTVLICGQPAARCGDVTLHCGTAAGVITTGFATVLIG